MPRGLFRCVRPGGEKLCFTPKHRDRYSVFNRSITAGRAVSGGLRLTGRRTTTDAFPLGLHRAEVDDYPNTPNVRAGQTAMASLKLL